MNTRHLRNIAFSIDGTLSIAVGLVALVVIYLWLRPYSFVIAFTALACLAVLKLIYEALVKRERALSQSAETGIAGILPSQVEQVRIRVLVVSTLLNASASICGVACLLTALHWYK